ncbi:L,D-transpeptidase family protein [uncultured Roseivirga sp.]|uniref:L,D-transpeptidase family protein n=1 Tax=uncultured Roseivirga sp. TaxID=543088 RepID=UPI000D7A5004|nr:L,D-transpeptidase family protein [uncultured Roseivirga sp.]PWL28432.1 MAG: hypothetical protein DCO95_13780 [Roseivirga sp. XM-24bin3]
MRFKWLVLGLSALVVLLVLSGYALYPKPPLDELALAREKLALADKQKASVYAKSSWTKAKMFYDSAMNSWSAENERLFFLRTYNESRDFANKSIEYAEMAAQEAKAGSKKLTNSFANRLKNIGGQLTLFDGSYKRLPMSKRQLSLLASSKLKHQELTNALAKGNTGKMEQKLKVLESSVGELVVYAKNTLEEFSREVPTWKKWVNSAIENSKRTGSALVVVNKYNRELKIYSRGKLISTYSVELGANWIGDKQRSGDKTTPEGHYKVLKRKANGQTKYYKAFLLDYPNEEDKKRFKQNKAEGIIPQSASIGNLIEIHGDGGKGIDWTDGCIALENSDMDKIWKLVPENTPVLIVGALNMPKTGN